MPPSRQLTNSVIGSSTNSATKPAQCSRKKASQRPNIAFAPSIITFSSRPHVRLRVKARAAGASDARKNPPSPRSAGDARAGRSSSATSTPATIENRPKPAQSASQRRDVAPIAAPVPRPARWRAGRRPCRTAAARRIARRRARDWRATSSNAVARHGPRAGRARGRRGAGRTSAARSREGRSGLLLGEPLPQNHRTCRDSDKIARRAAAGLRRRRAGAISACGLWRSRRHSGAITNIRPALADKPMVTPTALGIPGDALNVGLEGTREDDLLRDARGGLAAAPIP